MGGKETRDFGSSAGNCFEGFPEARSLPARGGGRAAFMRVRTPNPTE